MAIPPRKPLGKSSQGCSWSPWNKVSIFPCSPKLKSWLSIFLVPPNGSVVRASAWQGGCGFDPRQRIQRPVSYTVPLCQSVMRGIVVCHLIVYRNICQRQSIQSCTVGYPEYQSGTQGIVACYMKCTPEYQSATKYMKSCQLHCTLMYQSVTWDIHLECIDILEYRSATIKVYEDLSAALVPGVSVSNPGYNSLSPRMFCSIGSRSILCRWLIFTGLHFRWQVPIHWLIDWYTREQCSLQVFIYTLLLTNIPVYIPCDRPLYSRLQTYILGNSVADRYSYTLSLTGIRVCTSGDKRLNLGTV